MIKDLEKVVKIVQRGPVPFTQFLLMATFGITSTSNQEMDVGTIHIQISLVLHVLVYMCAVLSHVDLCSHLHKTFIIKIFLGLLLQSNLSFPASLPCH